MAAIGARRKVYGGAVTIPATKSAGAATISSSELYPFEATGFGGANVIISVSDLSKITDSVTVNSYVSFDSGTTWYLFNADTTTIANGSGSTVVRRNLPLAPRVRVDVVFDSSGALASGHGIDIDVEFYELDPESRRVEAFDSITTGQSGDTKAAGDSTWAGSFGDTIDLNGASRVLVVAYSADLSAITDTFTYNWQSSADASHWWTGDTLTSIGPANGSGVHVATKTISTGLSQYGRIAITGDTASAMTGDNASLRMFILAQD